MKVKHIITTCGIIAAGIATVNGVKALEYTDSADVQFTFNSMLEMSISSDSLEIADLAPGNSAASDPIDIKVYSNNAYGYELTATVGDSSTYDNTDLTHTGGGAVFGNLATNANLALNSITAGKWGYSISTDGGTNYSNFNGLYKYDSGSESPLNSSTTAAGTAVTKFKIGAAAENSQLGGTYNNVITFKAVSRISTD